MHINLSREEVVEAVQKYLVERGLNRQLGAYMVAVEVEEEGEQFARRYHDFNVVVEMD